MAEDKKIKGISKQNTGFPDYLDFNKLRSESIEYLGKLSGKIWTDHNVHDPGITILEMLCYALMDLGYRTNLPVEDILTADPSNTGKDTNFFTPAQILGNNPLTIIDYRKLLIDIDGVRNAWLETAMDMTNICDLRTPNNPTIANTDECIIFLNGLYHVYLDTEKVEPEHQEHFDNEVVQRVKETLMAHRNLCEDFADITVLCKLDMGVCAEIELEESADTDKVYVALVENLRNYFTPTPTFYTLQQLLDNDKNIENIFSGRPIDLSVSHGFVDTDEFEKIVLRKELHLSDIYHIIFSIPGVKTVKNLKVKKCGNDTGTSDWKLPIPKNHVLEFSPHCSGFRFIRKDIPVQVDSKKFETLFNINFRNTGKILYRSPSPYLDASIPQGIYHTDLKDYYSIQHEFPRLYGISEGGLPDSASPLRKAQALQLKGYLLFFDQLLANYLSQLQNIRNLFALYSPEEKAQQHTYFINELQSVPEMNKLLRFGTDGNYNESLGTEGNILLFPVDRDKLTHVIAQGNVSAGALENLKSFGFTSVSAQVTAIEQVKDDLYNDAFSYEVIETRSGDLYYYLSTTSGAIALLSKKGFSGKSAAMQHIAAVKYIASFDENYRTFLTSDNKFSFAIELNIASFSSYLQLVIEDEDLYLQRRTQFLDHLLARFSEKFTDFALLSYKGSDEKDLKKSDINAKENFLQHYDDLSSNRGKGYDYLSNRWNSENISGFEKKIKANLGLNVWKKNSLCNFVVEEYDDQYIVNLTIGRQKLLTLPHTFDSRSEAHDGAKETFRLMGDPTHYHVEYMPHLESFVIKLRIPNRVAGSFITTYRSEREALLVIENLSKLISDTPLKDVFASQFIFKYHLEDTKQNVIRISENYYANESEALAGIPKVIQFINDESRWEMPKETRQPEHLGFDNQNKSIVQFIDLRAFKVDIKNTIVGKPDKFFYEVLDEKHCFKFISVSEFENDKAAKAHCDELLTWMLTPSHYQVVQNQESKKFALQIIVHESAEAICSATFNDERSAAEMKNSVLEIINKHRYTLSVKKTPYRWKFNYYLGFEPAERITFESVDEYKDEDAAYKTLNSVSRYLHQLDLIKQNETWLLSAHNKKVKVPTLKLIHATISDTSVLEASTNQLKEFHEAVEKIKESNTPESFQSSVDINELSKSGRYVYRLIDKDHRVAMYTNTFASVSEADAMRRELNKNQCNTLTYPEICFGKESIETYTSGKTTWYHYVVVVRIPFVNEGKETPLFKSIMGYASESEAMKSLKKKYLEIIMLASEETNYGKAIRLDELRVHGKSTCDATNNIVFIPRETLNTMGSYDDASIRNIIKVANAYPLRQTVYGSPKFNSTFPCDAVPEKPIDRCNPTKEKNVYFFRISDNNGTKGESFWQSTSFFESEAQASSAFQNFLTLLCFPGNYYVACDDCAVNSAPHYRVFIREVLAESTDRFKTAAEAWGRTGIQKFICTAQADNSFFKYQKHEDCCLSFYIACPSGILVHPCKYDAAKSRDMAIESLFRGINNVVTKKEFSISQEKNELVLHGNNGIPFARVISRIKKDTCEIVMSLIQAVTESTLEYQQNENSLVATSNEYDFVATAAGDFNSLDAWKSEFKLFACFFPIVPDSHNKHKYFIEIKLPGFESCQNEEPAQPNCGCPDKTDPPEVNCHIAWRSPCSFNSCEEAFNAYRQFLPILLNYANYQALFECECNSFGIGLHHKSAPSRTAVQGAYQTIPGDIVAYNPQCYSDPQQVCDAVSKAQSLINAEGLHVVEHILLRPRCADDCQCNEYSARCDNNIDCRFTWKERQTDPCKKNPEVCFVPGDDRFSFIATVVLPAWPQRFRSRENKLLIEQMLQREAPAHVLLRILWLAPHDFCCFEKKYKEWNTWLAQKQTCDDGFSTCDFLHFLFQRNYECLEECNACPPCEDNQETANPCFNRITEKQETQDFLEQVNTLYCWNNSDCDQYQFVDCESRLAIENELRSNLIGQAETTLNIRTSRQDKKATPEKQVTEVNKEPETTKLKQRQPVKWMNTRAAAYKVSVDEIIAKRHENLFARKVQAFLNDPIPTTTRASKILDQLIVESKSKKAGKLTKKQIVDLSKAIVCAYLDKVLFSGNDDAIHFEQLKLEIQKLKQNKIDIKSILQHWKPDEVAGNLPEVDVHAVRDIFKSN